MTLNKKLEQLTKNKNFDCDQIFEISHGLEKGLSIEEVKLYADPKFTDDQMFLLKRILLENNKEFIKAIKQILEV